MEHKHTPGPWVTGNCDPCSFGKQRGAGTEPIGFVYAPAFAERSEIGQRAIADARLIASSPELLEVLEGVLHFSDAIQPGQLGDELHRWLAAARKVIAKATAS